VKKGRWDCVGVIRGLKKLLCSAGPCNASLGELRRREKTICEPWGGQESVSSNVCRVLSSKVSLLLILLTILDH